MNGKSTDQKSVSSFKPYIPADRKIPEFTITSIILGCILSIIFSAANAYLGAKVGMTVSASIPAAVISMGVLRCILRKNSILENNMVQTIASAGESVAAGCVFTLPALYIWASKDSPVSNVISKPAWITVFLIALIGGLLGITLMVPLRKALIVKEHGVLPYPEGIACAEVLLAGEKGSTKSSLVFSGLGISALFSSLAGSGLNLFKSEVTYEFPKFKGAAAGLSLSPALMGVGYICGFKISAMMFAGSALSWFVLMPLISFFGGNVVIWPAKEAISTMAADDLWANYIRYIGAGAVASAGIIGLIKSLPLLAKTFIEAVNDFKLRNENISIKRTDKDLSIVTVMIMSVALVISLMILPNLGISPLIAIIVFILSLFFCAVTSKIVGYVGASNNPASGMTIASLLLISSVLMLTGAKGPSSWVVAISAAGIVCLVSCVASDMSQDLKTGYILGATPRKQQVGEVIGVVSAALVVGFVLSVLDKAWGFGGKDIVAPQAGLMKLVTEGVMGGELPWNLIFVGAAIAVICEIIGIASMPFAVGLYLPIGINACVFLGGLVKLIVDRCHKSEKSKEESNSRGLLFASGMIAGEGVIGVILAALTAFSAGKYSVIDSLKLKLGSALTKISEGQEIVENVPRGSLISLLFMVALVVIFVRFIFVRKKDKITK